MPTMQSLNGILFVFVLTILWPATLGSQPAVHRAVIVHKIAAGSIAYDRLSPQDQRRLGRLMASHPCYSLWRQQTTTPSNSQQGADRQILLNAAIGASRGEISTEHAPMPECEKEASSALTAEASEPFMHSQFDKPRPGATPSEIDLVLMRNVLRSHAPTKLRAGALVEVIRLIPELHEINSCLSHRPPYRITADKVISGPLGQDTSYTKDEEDAAANLVKQLMQTDTPVEAWDLSPRDWVEEDCNVRQVGSFHEQNNGRDEPAAAKRVQLSALRLATVIHEDLAFDSE